MPIVFTTDTIVVTPPPPPIALARDVTGDAILDMRPGIGQVRTSWVWDVLDKNLRTIGRLHPVSTTPPTIEARGDDTVKRVLSGLQLAPADLAAIDPTVDRIRPSMLLETGDSYPCGVFMFSDANRHRETSGVWLDGSMWDQTVILDQPRDKALPIWLGVSVGFIIQLLLDEVKFTNYSIEDTAEVVGTPVAWSAGESRYKMLSDLFTLAGFYPPYFDNHGTLIGRRVPDQLALNGWDHLYPSGPTGRIVAESIVEADKTVQAPNRYVVIDNGPTGTPIVGSYRIPAHWPHSIENRGYKVTEKVAVNGLKSRAAAKAAARRAAFTDLRAGLAEVHFDSPPDPRHDLFAVVNYHGLNYKERSHSMICEPGGTHSHVLKGIV